MRSKVRYYLVWLFLLLPTYAQGVGLPIGGELPVCEGLSQVREAIWADYSLTCAQVKAAELSQITGFLILNLSGMDTLRPGEFDGLSEITHLDIRGSLRAIEVGALRGMPKLISLSLNGNDLSSFNPEVFLDVPNLVILSLSRNQFTEIPVGMFTNLPNLRELRLEGNSFHELRSGVFDSLPSLGFVHVGNSGLETIADEAFAQLKDIVSVDVTRSPLTRTSPAAFRGVPNVNGLPAGFAVETESEWRP